MVDGIHFLLTYSCTFECDHCFLFCSPESRGTFTGAQIRSVLDEADKMGTVEWIYFEGGEPFLFYALMLDASRQAKSRGYKVGVVTNAYWATNAADALLWLRPLAEIGIDDLSISDDAFHQSEEAENTAKMARQAAEELELPVRAICLEAPEAAATETDARGKPIVGGDVRFRGRAVEKLSEGLPRLPADQFRECPYEELEKPERVHIDAYGHVQICQGISMGNMWKMPLSELAANYRPHEHPICGSLLRGGPHQLARDNAFVGEAEYIDACHYCFEARKSMLDKYAEQLAPRQVYGLE